MKIDVSNDHFKASNILGIVKISDQLDLEKIYLGLENVSYEPEVFSGLVYHNENPTGTATLFKTGKVICSGTNDIEKMKKIVSEIINKLKILEIPVYDTFKIEIKNMVFTKDLGQPINLAKVALSFGLENVDYEPEDFPGLVYRIDEPQATFILFGSGKIICTGAKANSLAEEAFKKLEKKLKRHKIL
jgi:transcription initiation factor TFIID TATA-box-binding protein